MLHQSGLENELCCYFSQLHTSSRRYCHYLGFIAIFILDLWCYCVHEHILRFHTICVKYYYVPMRKHWIDIKLIFLLFFSFFFFSFFFLSFFFFSFSLGGGGGHGPPSPLQMTPLVRLLRIQIVGPTLQCSVYIHKHIVQTTMMIFFGNCWSYRPSLWNQIIGRLRFRVRPECRTRINIIIIPCSQSLQLLGSIRSSPGT